MRLEIQTLVTPTDVRDARWAWYFRSAFGRIAAAALAFMVLLTALQLQRGDVELARANVPIVLFLALLPLAVGLTGLNSPAVRRFTEGPVGYRFDEDGFEVSLARATAAYGWAEVKSGFESRRFFVLVTAGVLQIIRKQDLTPDTVANLRALLRARMGSRMRLAG